MLNMVVLNTLYDVSEVKSAYMFSRELGRIPFAWTLWTELVSINVSFYFNIIFVYSFKYL
jgi:hypothetical protein